jgi:methylated-DNA-protein-cysteine methyltransferase-like protein
MDDDAHRILAAVHAIPRGDTASYGEIARRAGLPRRARLVARVLSHNRDPALPWHRVVRADRRIAFPAESEGFHEQVRRLNDEGVVVRHGRVARMRCEDDLDAALWAPR